MLCCAVLCCLVLGWAMGWPSRQADRQADRQGGRQVRAYHHLTDLLPPRLPHTTHTPHHTAPHRTTSHSQPPTANSQQLQTQTQTLLPARALCRPWSQCVGQETARLPTWAYLQLPPLPKTTQIPSLQTSPRRHRSTGLCSPFPHAAYGNPFLMPRILPHFSSFSSWLVPISQRLTLYTNTTLGSSLHSTRAKHAILRHTRCEHVVS